ncbi:MULTISPECIES: alpha/beta hydrolase [unclassified Curtobacterium]|uniref:alpha/beta hydrolase n=1 Tax=unclassified Curtobacterium TaxID=257496 RepID=UPI000DAA3E23|nr:MULTISPECIES: alpha/beta hydrolase [unclassified Curtobacterium]PZE28939.1 alpha/beta hydrolase [Curtobacterium sp. MCBD17_028]PZE73732.1 alpha/beta hydrolase [Curtobacterium sp. MCBD17_019]PZF57552.1 alpha/beta hydrolase [Curtobacterium sp. MCBD17_034]PZF65322.1 alpha/beta hydrolase [Curtobacterium sp. MCBD17_013]PZM33644.1 alpha/beta hydrolase [Curtobacterium sp. MCBD17_031]
MSTAPDDRVTEIRSDVVLPALRTEVDLVTDDHLVLVGELAEPEGRPAAGTIVTLHPLPTAGGFMDSHVFRKAAARLPALAAIAVLRFNFRSVSSPRGTSEGAFGDGVTEGFDLRAAVAEVRDRGLPAPWLVGWSFGTEVVLQHGIEHVRSGAVAGVVLLSPPLHRTTDDVLARWRDLEVPVVAFVPEHDDFLRPDEAARRFAIAPAVRVVPVAGAKHLWVGERAVRVVLDAIADLVVPGSAPLPTTWPVAD